MALIELRIKRGRRVDAGRARHAFEQKSQRVLAGRNCHTGTTCAIGQLLGASFAPGGKSGLHRAACRLTAGGVYLKGFATDSATENIPP